MREIVIKDKQEYLNENYPFENPPKLLDFVRCIHCDSKFQVLNFKVFKERSIEYICCQNAPNCNGTVIDWFPT